MENNIQALIVIAIVWTIFLATYTIRVIEKRKMIATEKRLGSVKYL